MGPVSPEQLVFKIDAHFGHQRGVILGSSSNLHSREEVFPPVGTDHPKGKLRSGKDYGFIQVLKHETQCGSSIGHSV